MPRRAEIACALLLLLPAACAPRGPAGAPAVPAPPAAGPAEAGILREVVVEGATVYDTAQVLRFLRVQPGDRAWRTAAEHAATLEARYHAAGYLAARVGGTLENGTLRLVVDEGRLAELVLEGVDPAVEDATRERLGLVPGTLLRESDILAAVGRLEDSSLGAFEAADWPPFAVEATERGPRLTIRLVQRRFRLAVVPGGGGPPWNPVDGVMPWAGLELTRYDATRFRHPSAYLRGGWGLESHDLRWAAGLRHPFGAGERVVVGYEHHDLTDSDDLFRASMFEGAGTVLLLGDPGDFFRRRGDEVYAFVAPGPRLQVGAAFRADEHAPLLDDDDDDLRPPASPGTSRSLIGTVRLARGGPLFDGARGQRESFLQRDLYGTRHGRLDTLRAEASLEWASAEALGGDFTFRRLLVNVRGEHAASPRLRLRARGLAGFTGGAPPPQRALGIGGPGTLRAREVDRLRGSHVLVANVEAALATTGAIPAPVVFYDGGTAWGGPGRGEGWRSDVGLGLEWPAGRAFLVRVDGAWALDPLPGDDRFRISGRVRLPF